MATPFLAYIVPVGGGEGGVPSHPIYYPPAAPPGIWPSPPGGYPSHPIAGPPPGYPSHPIAGVPPMPTHPIAGPPFYPSQGPIYGGGYPSHPIYAPPLYPSHPIYWPSPPEGGEGGEPKPPGAENLPPIVVWIPGVGYVTATPGVPPKPTPEPTPPA